MFLDTKMVYVTLYFFDQNVIVTRSHTSWLEACAIIRQHIIDKIIEYECKEEISLLDMEKQKIFSCISDKILLVKNENNIIKVCELLVEFLEQLDICKFDRQTPVGDHLLLRGVVGNKNFLIEISEE